MRLAILIGIILVLLTIISCEEPTFPISSLPRGQSKQNVGDTVYTQINPVWYGFNEPQDIIVGNEPFIYIADTKNDRIVMLDIAGNILGYSKAISRPIAIAQDLRHNLIVCAEFDTVLSGVTTTFGAVYKIDLVSVGHKIGDATLKRIYFDPTDSQRRYSGAAALYNNSYYISQTGPKNEPWRVIKDNAILYFHKTDSLITPIGELQPDGTGLMAIHTTTAVATLPRSRSIEFVFCQKGENILFKVQWVKMTVAGQTSFFASKFYPSTSGNIGLLVPNKFKSPEDVTLDPSGNLFVVDSETDSLYRFSTKGMEAYSFGGTGSGPLQFRRPHGVAVFDKTVYVADTGNNRILRFRLSTELQ